MSGIERAAPDIYLLEETTREAWFISVTVILGKTSIGLVDTGYEHTPDQYILPFFKEQKRRPDEVGLIVNTHGDGDHINGNRRMKDITGAPVAAHELEYDAIGTADRKLTDGETLRLGDRDFTVIHSPGHRPGNICLYDKANLTILTGDTVVGTRENLIRMGAAPYIKSLRKLLDLEIDLMCMAHPFLPAGKAVLNGREAGELIRQSIAIAEDLPQC